MNVRDEIELCNLQDPDDVGELWALSKRLFAVYEAAQRIIRESSTQDNGDEQIHVTPWVALANAIDRVQRRQSP